MKTVLCHGCWDLLHLGHIRHLKEAKKLGEHLTVSVTSDKYVNKGPGRPRFNEDERAEALMALSFVDRVLVNYGPDAVELIQHLKPSAYVKGSDYCGSPDEGLAREAAAIAEVGGDMIFTSTKKWSSTELLRDIKREPYEPYVEALKNYECNMSFDNVVSMILEARVGGGRLFFIGNGGSAAIASHMAADFQKAGKTAAFCFNDAAQVTALANDVGYESVFSEPLRMHATDGDMLFAISSSGESLSILNGAVVADQAGCKVVTLSGFDQRNTLRGLGEANFYVPSDRYGVVEASHLVILHSLLDAVVEAL